MRKSLRKVPQPFPAGPRLLRIKPQVVGVAQHLLKHQPRLIQPARVAPPGARQRLHQPEGAHIESAFMPGQPIVKLAGVVAVHQAVRNQPPLLRATVDGVNGAQHPRVGGRHKKHQRHNQVGGVQRVAVVVLHKRPLLPVPTFGLDFLIDFVPHLAPAHPLRRKRPYIRQPDGAIQHHPAHQLGIDEMLPPAPRLPDTLVGQPPVVANPVRHPPQLAPKLVGNRLPVPIEQIHRIHQLAVNIQLQLIIGAVANPHRPRTPVAVQMIQIHLVQFPPPVNPVQNL